MLIHQPTDNERIVWYGGDSTQLHYERLDTDNASENEWKTLCTRTLSEFPHSVKEFKTKVDDFYQYCAETNHA